MIKANEKDRDYNDYAFGQSTNDCTCTISHGYLNTLVKCKDLSYVSHKIFQLIMS